MFLSVLPELHKEAKKCIHSKINFQLLQDMLPTIRPQVASLSGMMTYTFFICLEGSRHLPHTGRPKMSTYAMYVSSYSLYSRLQATQKLTIGPLLFDYTTKSRCEVHTYTNR